MSIFIVFFGCLAAALSLPVLMFAAECLIGSMRGPTRPVSAPKQRPKTLILIPAHNEEAVIRFTLESVIAQTHPTDETLVVADNCTDATASICREYGVRVVERSSSTERGKGYALAYGLSAAADLSPDVVIILDADCVLEDDALDQLVYTCVTENAPVQARYLIKHPDSVSAGRKVSELAVFIKNQVRMRGLSAMGSSVPLSGSGMAFPYAVLESAELASGEIVEDMKLGISLALQGTRVVFIDHVGVTSLFPASEAALAKQRERWEHGHMGMILGHAPKLLFKSIVRLNMPLSLFALDLIIPPLSLLVVSVVCLFIVASVLSHLTGVWFFGAYALLLLLLPLVALVVAWHSQCRHIIGGRELITVPAYIASKLGSYLRFFVRRQTMWIKTERE